MGILTLTTDFGTEDGNVGVMKGVALGIAPALQIVDITHQVAPQNIRQAAFVLARQIFYFPGGSVHVVVVDPGVGTDRRPIAARVGGQLLVGPDNGVFTPLYQRAELHGWPLEIVDLTAGQQFWRNEISHVFHGRDVFAPVGAHLASGVGLHQVGVPVEDPVLIPWPEAARQGNQIWGEVTYIDHFGNLFTNMHAADLAGEEILAVKLAGVEIEGMVNAFGERGPGTLIALYSSTDELLIAEVNGSAAMKVGAKVGDQVLVNLRG
ncbi:MAG: SAM-dependent chlorinase/fluorinase [Anaerolineales bacterium]|nr:SAM-dependent chlorinase/fluorinase [Anaerolineales bacterium]